MDDPVITHGEAHAVDGSPSGTQARPGAGSAPGTVRPEAVRHSYADKVLYAFVREGRLVSIPAQQRKRRVILRWLASTDFGEEEAVSERDVGMRLALRHRDVAALRRYLVEERYLSRAGGIYRRRPQGDWPTDPADVRAVPVQDERSPEE